MTQKRFLSLWLGVVVCGDSFEILVLGLLDDQTIDATVVRVVNSRVDCWSAIVVVPINVIFEVLCLNVVDVGGEVCKVGRVVTVVTAAVGVVDAELVLVSVERIDVEVVAIVVVACAVLDVAGT